MTTNQPEALRIADAIEALTYTTQDVAPLLRQLHTKNAELLDALLACVDGWKHGYDIFGPMHRAQQLLLKYNAAPPEPEPAPEPPAPPPVPAHKCEWEDHPDGGSKCTICGDWIPF